MEGEQMRYLAIGVCVLAAACGSSAPTAPEAVANPGATALGVTSARAGADLPFRGRLEATEDASTEVHHLAGAGNGTHLGRFTYAADIAIDEVTGDGAGDVTYTAAKVVNLRVPISLGRMGLDRIPGLSADSISSIRRALDEGLTGPILAVDEDSDGNGVRIVLE